MDLSTIKAILRPALLPPLLAYYFAPRTSLASWLAVSALPPSEPISPDSDGAKCLKRRRWIPAVVFIGIFAFDFWAIRTQSTCLLNGIFYTTIGLLFQTSLMSVIASKFRALQWVAFRTPTGLFTWGPAPGSVSWPKVVLAVLLATGINVQTFIGTYEGFGLVAVFAVVYRSLSSNGYRTISIRGVMIAMLSWVALTTLLVGGMVMALIKLMPQNVEGDVHTLEFKLEDDVEDAYSERMQRMLMLLSRTIFATVPGVLITVCYRFDYHLHLASLSAQSLPVPALLTATIDPPAKHPTYTAGVLLPSRPSVSRRFLRPYYFSALSAWIITNLSLSALITLIPMQAGLKEVFNQTASFEMLALVVEVPVMVVAVLFTALIRRQGRAMWTYREVWMVKPEVVKEGAVRLEEEEAVPPYEVQDFKVVEEEEVPAYEVIVEDVKA